LDNFIICTLLGAGTYGTVYSGVNLSTLKEVALKFMNILIPDEGIPISVIREISLIK
jgi:serine/threonine protein kinase